MFVGPFRVVDNLGNILKFLVCENLILALSAFLVVVVSSSGTETEYSYLLIAYSSTFHTIETLDEGRYIIKLNTLVILWAT